MASDVGLKDELLTVYRLVKDSGPRFQARCGASAYADKARLVD